MTLVVDTYNNGEDIVDAVLNRPINQIVDYINNLDLSGDGLTEQQVRNVVESYDYVTETEVQTMIDSSDPGGGVDLPTTSNRTFAARNGSWEEIAHPVRSGTIAYTDLPTRSNISTSTFETVMGSVSIAAGRAPTIEFSTGDYNNTSLSSNRPIASGRTNILSGGEFFTPHLGANGNAFNGATLKGTSGGCEYVVHKIDAPSGSYAYAIRSAGDRVVFDNWVFDINPTDASGEVNFIYLLASMGAEMTFSNCRFINSGNVTSQYDNRMAIINNSTMTFINCSIESWGEILLVNGAKLITEETYLSPTPNVAENTTSSTNGVWINNNPKTEAFNPIS